MYPTKWRIVPKQQSTARTNQLACALAMASVLAAAACAQAPQRPYAPLDLVPASFIASYPQGSQVREEDDLQATFVKNKKRFSDAYGAALREKKVNGVVRLAIALNQNGSVEAVSLVNTPDEPGKNESTDFEKTIMAIALRLNFGPAPGDGYYVFWYPITFNP